MESTRRTCSALLLALALSCPLHAPVPGPPVAGFAVTDGYQGHWGVDLSSEPGAPVRAPISGEVTFAGVVVGNRTVTIASGDVRVSLSYLRTVGVSAGDRVDAGDVVGRSGLAHGTIPAVHLSVRVGRRYRDPLPLLRCRLDIWRGLWLVPVRE